MVSVISYKKHEAKRIFIFLIKKAQLWNPINATVLADSYMYHFKFFLNGHLGHYYSNVELKCFISLQIGIQLQKDEGNTSDIPLQVCK